MVVEYLLYIHLFLLIIGIIIHKVWTTKSPEVFDPNILYQHSTWIAILIAFGLGYFVHKC